MTSPSRVERVARALCPVDPDSDRELVSNGKWYQAGSPHWQSWIGEAGAAIAAADAALAEAGYAIMPREPTDLMAEAGMPFTGDPCWQDDVKRAWRAMWDAAPKPEEHPWGAPQNLRDELAKLDCDDLVITNLIVKDC